MAPDPANSPLEPTPPADAEAPAPLGWSTDASGRAGGPDSPQAWQAGRVVQGPFDQAAMDELLRRLGWGLLQQRFCSWVKEKQPGRQPSEAGDPQDAQQP